VLSSAIVPSVAERFLFSGRSGHPPRLLGVSLGPPGDLGKETDRNETCFFVQDPTGAAEKVRTKMTWARKNLPKSPPLMEVALVLSGPASGLFSRLLRIFSRRANAGMRASGIVPPSGREKCEDFG
jgi:hypothetical protein